jgi:hypothetical protein
MMNCEWCAAQLVPPNEFYTLRSDYEDRTWGFCSLEHLIGWAAKNS